MQGILSLFLITLASWMLILSIIEYPKKTIYKTLYIMHWYFVQKEQSDMIQITSIRCYTDDQSQFLNHNYSTIYKFIYH